MSQNAKVIEVRILECHAKNMHIQISPPAINGFVSALLFVDAFPIDHIIHWIISNPTL
jgi:hypothetical protein